MKHWREHDGTIHCEGSDGSDYTLCGAALEGVEGDQEMTATDAGIDCNRCIGIIKFCWKIRAGQLKPAFQRRGKR